MTNEDPKKSGPSRRGFLTGVGAAAAGTGGAPLSGTQITQVVKEAVANATKGLVAPWVLDLMTSFQSAVNFPGYELFKRKGMESLFKRFFERKIILDEYGIPEKSCFKPIEDLRDIFFPFHSHRNFDFTKLTLDQYMDLELFLNIKKKDSSFYRFGETEKSEEEVLHDFMKEKEAVLKLFALHAPHINKGSKVSEVLDLGKQNAMSIYERSLQALRNLDLGQFNSENYMKLMKIITQVDEFLPRPLGEYYPSSTYSYLIKGLPKEEEIYRELRIIKQTLKDLYEKFDEPRRKKQEEEWKEEKAKREKREKEESEKRMKDFEKSMRSVLCKVHTTVPEDWEHDGGFVYIEFVNNSVNTYKPKNLTIAGVRSFVEDLLRDEEPINKTKIVYGEGFSLEKNQEKVVIKTRNKRLVELLSQVEEVEVPIQSSQE